MRLKHPIYLDLIDLMPTTPILQTQNILKNRDEQGTITLF
jgi:hypothetical protein